MRAFTSHTGTALPLRRANVDTDQIVPAEYLKRVTRRGFEEAPFAGWRSDPDFVLNHACHAGVSVLVAGPDFGTGSSREHAVWALQDHGFRVVISARFADIFRGNSGKAGLLAAQVAQGDVDRLWSIVETAPATPVTVDLVTREIRAADLVATFAIDEYTRHRLLNGLDDIGITLSHESDIATYELARPLWRPATLPGA